MANLGDVRNIDFSDGSVPADHYNNWFQDGWASSFGGTTNKMIDQAYNQYREDTQYQRMVKDLEAAGINPWIAFSNGGSGNAAYYTPTASRQDSNDKGQTLRNLMTTLFLIARIATM